jgi:hypothetical protein
MEKDILDQFYEMHAQIEEEYETNFRNLLLKEQIELLRNHCKANNLKEKEIKELRDILDNFLFNFYTSLDFEDTYKNFDNINKNKHVWSHVDLVNGLLEGLGSEEFQTYKKIRTKSFNECARTYLQYPWLQSDTLDWIFIDVNMFCVLYNKFETLKKRNLKNIILNTLSKEKSIRTYLYNLRACLKSF